MTDYTQRKEILLKGIKDGSFPKFLYKYRDPKERTEDIFRSSSIWFSQPSSFNDPFDCQLSEVEEHSDDDASRFFSHILKGRSDEEYLMRSGPKKNELELIMEKAKSITLERMGVLCLSKNFDSILMWSHYTDCHKGLVIEFDLEEDPDFFLSPVTVKYSSNYEPTNYFANPEDSIKRIVSTKSDAWQYEAEVRILKPETKGLIEFKPKSIRRVIFGCKADQIFIDKIRSLCSSPELKHVQFSSMKIARSRFSLEHEHLAT